MARFAIDMLIMALLGAAAMSPLTPADSTDVRLANVGSKVDSFMKAMAGNHKAKAMSDMEGGPPPCALKCVHVETPTTCSALKDEFVPGGCAASCGPPEKAKIMAFVELEYCAIEIFGQPYCTFPCQGIDTPTTCSALEDEFVPGGCAASCTPPDKAKIMSLLGLTDCAMQIFHAPYCTWPCHSIDKPTTCSALQDEFVPGGCAAKCGAADKAKIMSMFGLCPPEPMPSPAPESV